MVELKSETVSDELLSMALKALSDTTRRHLLTQLVQNGPMRVTDLAAAYSMSLNGISKHIKVLEQAQLITRRQLGRVHWIEANLQPVNQIQQWLDTMKSVWAMRLDKLETLLTSGDNDHE